MKRICCNCNFIRFTKEDGVNCDLKEIDNIDEQLDIENECCSQFLYNKCLDCEHEECLLEYCDIW